MKRDLKYFGYTYLEILMGLMILGVLSGLGLMMYPGVQKSARDNQRRSDLKQYQTSLENYARKNQGYYPSRNAETHASDMSGGTPNVCTTYLGLSQCPADPKYGQSICRGATCNYYFWSNYFSCIIFCI